MNHFELQQSLKNCSTPMERIDIIWKEYEKITGIILNRPPSNEERKQVEEWFRINYIKQGFSEIIRVSSRKQLISTTLFSKSVYLGQCLCNTCETVIDKNGQIPLDYSFPIQINPWSAQSVSNNKKIKKAINHELQNYSINCCLNYPICISIVAFVPRSSKRKDVDNLAKGILDSMEGIVYKNDSQIQCLQVRRIESAGSIGYYSTRARAVYSWDADVIYDSPKPPNIAYGNPVDFKKSQ